MMRNIFLSLFLMLILASGVTAGERIIYSHLSEDGFWQLWEMAPDGTDKRQITHSPFDKRSPSWDAKGKNIVYRSNNGGLFIAGLDGGNEREILKKYRNIVNPHVSEATGEIVFTRFDPQSIDSSDIWKSDMAGGEAKLLTKDNQLKYQPVFSPDGKKIAFVKSNTDKQHHIWMMDADGNNQHQLTREGQFNTLPKFSPDGNRLTFTSNQGGDYDIYVMDLNTTKILKYSGHEGLDTTSSYSPDGNNIVFVSTRMGNHQIFQQNLMTQETKQLTRDKDGSVDPIWIEVKE